MIRPPLDPASGVRLIKLAPHQLTAPITDPKDLFVLAHLGIPRVDPAHWSLTIDGLVGGSRTFTLDELKARLKVVVEAVHNCSGSPMEPTVPTRRVANLRWGGVDLVALLDELGVDARARYLWSYGLDGGDFANTSCEWFVKDLPLARLAAGGVLLAYELNGAPLSAEHGFPLRLVVPGYYGTNSVKWLWRLQLSAERFDGLFTTRLYNDLVTLDDVAAGQPPHRPAWAIAPDAVIVAPAPDAALRLGEAVEIQGWAWSFRGIEAVEVSVDRGASFVRAALEPRRGWAWQRFSLPWRPGMGGEHVIVARAFEHNGASQPRTGARNESHTVCVAVA